MASNAFTDHLEVLLADADELGAAHKSLRTGKKGRQWGLGSLNRAVVVTCVSSWEAYVEELMIEALEALRPASPPMGLWPSLNATARGQIGRFNNPNPEKVVSLVADSIGLQDLDASWYWHRCSAALARQKLSEALRTRHEIAHGVNPRPIVHNIYATWLPGFFRRLARCTDTSVRAHLVDTLGIPNPWPK